MELIREFSPDQAIFSIIISQDPLSACSGLQIMTPSLGHKDYINYAESDFKA